MEKVIYYIAGLSTPFIIIGLYLLAHLCAEPYREWRHSVRYNKAWRLFKAQYESLDGYEKGFYEKLLEGHRGATPLDKYFSYKWNNGQTEEV